MNKTLETLKKRNKITDYLLYLCFIILLFGSGYKLAEWQIESKIHNQSNTTFLNGTSNARNKDGKLIDFSLFWDTWEKIENKYIDDAKIDPQKMYYGSIKGMVASLGDQYTFFLTPDENKQSKDDLGGKFQGIGAQLGLKDGKIVVVAPLKNSPAEKSGVKSGDIILKVDDASTKDWTLTQAVSKIRGPENTVVRLDILRNEQELKVEITRKQILIESVESTVLKKNNKQYVHVTVNQFGDNTNSEWDKAINDVKKNYENGTIKGMILDLRGNPGGYLESAVYLASEFINEGQVIVKQETSNQKDTVYKVRRTGKLLDIPLVVIINEGSASASEILAGALRDYKRATLVGKKSFGKGSVQEALDLKDGAGLHVTVAKWILPNGDWINGVGIAPNIDVENKIDDKNTLTDDTDVQLQKALETISSL